jgi:ankyrin repeat protein
LAVVDIQFFNAIVSHQGYTPLHLASMHGKVDVINLLIDDYRKYNVQLLGLTIFCVNQRICNNSLDANVHIRDHSGKEPKHVVTKNISEEIKRKCKRRWCHACLYIVVLMLDQYRCHLLDIYSWEK